MDINQFNWYRRNNQNTRSSYSRW